MKKIILMTLIMLSTNVYADEVIHTLNYLQDGDQILIGRTELRLNGLEG